MGKKGFLMGECKWRERRPAGMEVLGDLKRKADLTGKPEWASNARFLIASSSGFSEELSSQKDVALIGPEELFEGRNQESGIRNQEEKK